MHLATRTHGSLTGAHQRRFCVNSPVSMAWSTLVRSLIDDAPCAQIEVAHLGVAELPVGSPYVMLGGINQATRAIPPERVSQTGFLASATALSGAGSR